MHAQDDFKNDVTALRIFMADAIFLLVAAAIVFQLQNKLGSLRDVRGQLKSERPIEPPLPGTRRCLQRTRPPQFLSLSVRSSGAEVLHNLCEVLIRVQYHYGPDLRIRRVRLVSRPHTAEGNSENNQTEVSNTHRVSCRGVRHDALPYRGERVRPAIGRFMNCTSVCGEMTARDDGLYRPRRYPRNLRWGRCPMLRPASCRLGVVVPRHSHFKLSVSVRGGSDPADDSYHRCEYSIPGRQLNEFPEARSERFDSTTSITSRSMRS
ncbi:hypothetical protein EVAR_37386_1 [Eumeta japonica]|uniref:Uncharacterized protein n=1 Tax=Eumeta variegata TaxID=151549 RepID=A0A4C1ZPC7_EUMVA|nr:hypothetical protein EVAR_37386_1 [Eumeta japonica]